MRLSTAHRRRLIAVTLLTAGVMSRAVSAQNEDQPASEPIVLQPTAQNPNTVQLEPDGPQEPWNPLEIGDFTLVDQSGATVTKQDLLGKPWVASFIFTRCAGACPLLVRKVYDLSQMVPQVDMRFVTITVDPEHDTVEKMKRYADVYEAQPERWLFLTGEKYEVYRLIRHGFKVAAWEQFGTERLPGYEFAHSLSLIHVGADGKVLGKYSSDVDSELRTLQRVLQGRIETPPEHRPVPPGSIVEGAPQADSGPLSKSNPALLAQANELSQSRIDQTGDGRQVELPPWAQRLPATNAMLNGLATILLLVGFSAIKAGNVRFHKKMMLFAFGVSIAFLTLYLVHKGALYYFTGKWNKKIDATGTVAATYLTILASHIALAATVPFLAIVTIRHGLKDNRDQHRRFAKVTFPIWLYVSVTGVIIYWMLYG
jgi:protein SCO1/2/putative membrane protein